MANLAFQGSAFQGSGFQQEVTQAVPSSGRRARALAYGPLLGVAIAAGGDMRFRARQRLRPPVYVEHRRATNLVTRTDREAINSASAGYQNAYTNSGGAGAARDEPWPSDDISSL